MGYKITKAAVIGSGTMGGGIAALLAGIGVKTLLLDIPAKDTKAGDPAKKRNAIVDGNFKNLTKMRPAQFFSAASIKNVSTGNIEDDLEKVADADWIIEVVVERLDIKQDLMAKLAKIAKPDAIISSNTSGLPIHSIAEKLDDNFTRRFMGTHFFNPPRYLHLLEIIPHPNTDPEALEFMKEFATRRLGKGIVIAKDEPNFIGNRFMSMVGMQAMNYALDNGYTIEEVDAITGPLIGRPKTATFNLNDLVGFDIAVHVANNLYPAIPDDPAREVLNHAKSKEVSEKMLENNWLGRKSGKGFYWMKRDGGKKELWALNLETMEYEPPTKPRFDSVGAHRKVEPVGERIHLLINEDDRAGQYLWHHHAFYLAYASNRVPEITETIVNVDNAQKWGFGHALGPFEIWDAIGVEDTIASFEDAGYPVSDWVKQMVSNGYKTFYERNDNGKVTGYYSPQEGQYVQLERDPMNITVADLRADGKEIVGNEDGSIYDLGDGVLLWEFHSKQNTITGKFREIGWKGLELLEQNDDYVAMVISNDAERFSIGANLMDAMGAGPDGIVTMIEDLQNLAMALRYSPKPVVVAPFNMTLGGGTELMMGADAIVAHIELYTGLVEVGVGIIPAGSGCKELMRRHVNPLAEAGAYVLPGIQKIFENIATAKVSESAVLAQELGFLTPTDKIVMNRSHLIGEAKTYAIGLSKTYEPREPEKIWAAGKEVYAALLLAIEQFKEAGYATEYDGFIAQKLAYILTGGALSEPQWVDQQLILNLEKQVILELIQQPKTQERVMYMLQNNKPLRN